jgi:hypothetical protein
VRGKAGLSSQNSTSPRTHESLTFRRSPDTNPDKQWPHGATGIGRRVFNKLSLSAGALYRHNCYPSRMGSHLCAAISPCEVQTQVHAR